MDLADCKLKNTNNNNIQLHNDIIIVINCLASQSNLYMFILQNAELAC